MMARGTARKVRLPPAPSIRSAGRMVQTLHAGTLPVSLIDRGTGDVPIVFLHGATQDRTIWTRQVAYFRRTHRCIAYDARGHGRTPLNLGQRERLSTELLARDCVAVLDALGIERAILCGVSLGGMTALQVAARAPERCAALVLANTPMALSLSPKLLTLIDWLNPYALLVPILRYTDPAGFARFGVRILRFVLGEGWARPEAANRLVRAFGRMPARNLVETYRAICETRLPDLTRVDVPALVVTGWDEADMIFRHAAEIARRIGRAELATLPGGHVTNLDSPDAFNVALDDFFGRWMG